MCSVITTPMAVVILPSVGDVSSRDVLRTDYRVWDPQRLLHLVAVQAAEAVEGRGFVALGESGVVEDGVDEVVDGAAEDHDGLADVDQLAGAFADDVHAEHLARVAVEDELEAAGGVAANLAAGGFAIVTPCRLRRARLRR